MTTGAACCNAHLICLAQESLTSTVNSRAGSWNIHKDICREHEALKPVNHTAPLLHYSKTCKSNSKEVKMCKKWIKTKYSALEIISNLYSTDFNTMFDVQRDKRYCLSEIYTHFEFDTVLHHLFSDSTQWASESWRCLLLKYWCTF